MIRVPCAHHRTNFTQLLAILLRYAHNNAFEITLANKMPTFFVLVSRLCSVGSDERLKMQRISAC